MSETFRLYAILFLLALVALAASVRHVVRLRKARMHVPLRRWMGMGNFFYSGVVLALMFFHVVPMPISGQLLSVTLAIYFANAIVSNSFEDD